MADYYPITLALAGVCQAAKLVQQFAHNGRADSDAFKASLDSLLQTSPENTLAVYGGNEAHLKLGLQILMEQLNGRDAELTRYWVSLLALEGKLNKSAQAKQQLAQRIAYLPSQLNFYHLLDEQMISNLASIYVDVISPLGNRIQVLGSPDYLQQQGIQHRIRACLLAGIRSAVLWRQVGGKKYQLLFSRSKIATTAQQIYSTF
ncbi:MULTISPECIES: high frequency lysogenization protein HflD [unclassified Avibacterium]|uniref:high frequency lysogenization protein HflD n=1 Tax=unclassified Avibacterium TaxID=2685287 RepID=UPI002026FEB1|nr:MULTISPECIES: high frequency lysogenization protein HflD [unclassified Avibacterium]URL01956.1 high frequency lysogenization protein HflD [Avibacterium sp. 20-126]MCW9699084.1 high frequency lysogenization protein HflD [Avibacterium sp. 20-129]MCW9718856.1 high frequency lysogenization protein HflD [Avibacterium sp. 21-599]MCW9733032.1 high frequency lysogenization protein HflD [Avibacterium sp. 20-15]URL05161.1 high frequency lysogenization protein HflD [Avibacterium sp. 20-132]